MRRRPWFCLGLVVLAAVLAGLTVPQVRAAAVVLTTGPTTSLSASPAAPNGDLQWFAGAAPLLTLTAADPEGAAAMTYYSWDTNPGPPGPGWSLYRGTLISMSGTHTLYFYSSDADGRVETTKSQIIKVDTVALAPTIVAPTGGELASTPVRGTITYDSSAADGVSGVDFVSFWWFEQLASGWSGVGTQVDVDQPTPAAGHSYSVEWNTTLVPDGRYRLQSQLKDVAGNTAWSGPQYVLVDNTGPTAILTNPAANAAIRGSSVVIGTANDANLSRWTLQIRASGAAAWNTLVSRNSRVIDGTLFTVDTSVGYPDGSYELRLVVTDTAGNTSSDLRGSVTIDNAKPTVVAATAAGPNVVNVVFSEELAPESIGPTLFSVLGLTLSAAALQADNRTVALSTSDQSGGAAYTVSVAGAQRTITDVAGNPTGLPLSAGFVGTLVDSTPPAAPTGLTAHSGFQKNIVSWTAGLEPDVAGHNVYRSTSFDGTFSGPINGASGGETSFSDTGYGPAGVYYYKVSAVDKAGNESAKSAAVSAADVSIAQSVGPEGATLSSSTGEIVVAIPAGSLSRPTMIEVVEGARPAGAGQFIFASNAYDLLPAGQTFATNISITVAYEPGGLDENAMRLVYDKSGLWTLAEGATTLDRVGKMVTVQVNHFTDFAAASADVKPPAVSSVTPARGATGVSVAGFVTMTFSEPMDPIRLDDANMEIRTGGAAGTKISLETVVFSADTKTVFLYPDRLLDVRTPYVVRVSGSGVTDLAGNPLGADFTSTFTTASTGVSPHDGYAVSTGLCRNCHAGGETAEPTMFVGAGEKEVCYVCHDGTGSSYNTKTTDGTSPFAWDFGDTGAGGAAKSSKVSYHPVPGASTAAPVTGVTMMCSNCHNAHGMTGAGARFLAPRKLDPSYAGVYMPQGGDAFCWTCHDKDASLSAGYISVASWSASTGFDHKTFYSTGDTGHKKSTGSLVMAQNPAVPSKENIACKGCHSEHGTTNDKLIAEQVNGQVMKFRSASAADYDLYYNPLCLACHGIAGLGGSYWPGAVVYSVSGHGTSTVPKTLAYAPSDTAATLQLQVKLCKQCHEPHGAGDAANAQGYPNLTRLFEENVCYRCHGIASNPTGAKNIQTEFAAANSHDLGMSTNAVRTHDQDAEDAKPVSGATGNSQLSGANRHVECADCHNVHAATPNVPHVQGTNALSGVLAGVWGVDAASPGSAWSDPSTWTWSKKSPATAEYQLCFKCHSAAAYGSTPPTRTNDATAGPTFWNSPTETYTDQSLEFNPNNASYHMVWSGTSQVPGTVSNFINGWTRTSQMYCSDCHKSSTTGDPKGSHGSATPWILGGYAVPESARYVTGGNGGALYSSKAARDADFTFCFGCHSSSFTGTGFTKEGTTNLHTLDKHLRACTNCHVAVPHGWNRKHMLYFGTGATVDPAPYNDHVGDTSYGLSSTMTLDRTPGTWLKEDCNGSGSVCHGN